MFELDMDTGWEQVPGTSGITSKPLSGDFDEQNRRGFRTRCIRIEPGGETFEPFEHAYWEEVFILEGEMTSKADNSTVRGPAYVIRPPATPHGPLVSRTGCTLIEFQYFADRTAGTGDYVDRRAALPPTGAAITRRRLP